MELKLKILYEETQNLSNQGSGLVTKEKQWFSKNSLTQNIKQSMIWASILASFWEPLVIVVAFFSVLVFA